MRTERMKQRSQFKSKNFTFQADSFKPNQMVHVQQQQMNGHGKGKSWRK